MSKFSKRKLLGFRGQLTESQMSGVFDAANKRTWIITDEQTNKKTKPVKIETMLYF